MPRVKRKLRLGSSMAAGAVCLAVAGCGGGSGNAVGLLKQTFCGNHRVDSGNLAAALTIDPSGSRTLTSPISLSLSGPFQSRGTGKLPESDLTIGLSALGNTLSAGVISTGTHGYVTLTGSNYQLPAASYRKLESSFANFATPPGCTGRSGALGKLHIQPLHWLTNPQVVGTQTVGGTSTTHIHAGINVPALLGDLGKFLKGSSLGSAGISSSTLSSLGSDVQHATFDLWTGAKDRTLRKLAIHLTLSVTGQLSGLLGGLRSAGIGLTLQYANLNQPQTITAPTNLQPYSQLQAKLRVLFSALRSQITSLITGGLSGGLPSGTGSTGTSGTTSGKLQKYSACIQAAGSDVAKMQKCAPLLSGK